MWCTGAYLKNICAKINTYLVTHMIIYDTQYTVSTSQESAYANYDV